MNTNLKKKEKKSEASRLSELQTKSYLHTVCTKQYQKRCEKENWNAKTLCISRGGQVSEISLNIAWEGTRPLKVAGKSIHVFHLWYR